MSGSISIFSRYDTASGIEISSYLWLFFFWPLCPRSVLHSTRRVHSAYIASKYNCETGEHNSSNMASSVRLISTQCTQNNLGWTAPNQIHIYMALIVHSSVMRVLLVLALVASLLVGSETSSDHSFSCCYSRDMTLRRYASCAYL